MNPLRWHIVQGIAAGGCIGYLLSLGGLHAAPVVHFAIGAFWGCLVGLSVDVWNQRQKQR